MITLGTFLLCSIFFFPSVVAFSSPNNETPQQQHPHRHYQRDLSKKRILGWLGDNVRTDIPISPFSLVLSPTPRALTEYELTQVHTVLQDYILTSCQASINPLMNFATIVSLYGTTAQWNPSRTNSLNQVVPASTTLYSEGGQAKYPFNVYQRAPTQSELDEFTRDALNNVALVNKLRTISGLGTITSISVPYPYSPPTRRPTYAPTKLPSRSPTAAPTLSPSRHPSRYPTKSPSESPTPSPSKLPTRSPTKSPTVQPTRQPIRSPTREPTTQLNPTLNEIVITSSPVNRFETDETNNESSIVNDPDISDTISSSSSWPLIVGISAGFTLMMCAALLIRKRKRLYHRTAKDATDFDSRSTDSRDSAYGLKAKSAHVPLVGRKDRQKKDHDAQNDDDDNVSEFSNAFPIPIHPLLPASDSNQQDDADSLNDVVDFPNLPFTQEEINTNPKVGIFPHFVTVCDLKHCIQPAHDGEESPLFEPVNEWEADKSLLLENSQMVNDGAEDFNLDNTWDPDDADADTIDIQLSQKLLATYDTDESFLIFANDDDEPVWDQSNP